MGFKRNRCVEPIFYFPSTHPDTEDAMTTPTPQKGDLISRERVLEKLGGISKSGLYNFMLKYGFPISIDLGKEDARSSKQYWYEDEVDAWIASRPRRKIGGLKQIQNRTA